MKYLMEAVSTSNVDALFCLGDMYFYGLEGLEIDYPKALELFKVAGKNGK